MQPRTETGPPQAQEGRVAVVAGSGLLPRQVVDALLRQGQAPVVIAIEGEANPTDYDGLDVHPVPPARLAVMLPKLNRWNVDRLVLAGGVATRPPLRDLRFPPSFLLQLPRLIRAYAQGDDGLLRAVIGFIESRGIKVLGAHEIVPDLLAPAGPLGRVKPDRQGLQDIEAAAEAARTIGRLDVGQAAIAVGGRAVALEGIEGTDGLLQRMKELRNHGRLAGAKGGVLAKCAKPQQDARADLPTIGPRTVSDAAEAGLSGIAVDAERAIVLDMAETIRRADSHGLFIFGMRETER
ncbi:LpxI family protein [Nitratireductor sp. CH_MIT9313-5]|uniref:LpxI family protein n=1 Tax=Nitratireductor sp. CH_MIT9313-5 TaxID=3107764 RepID=UPI003008200B